MRISEISVGGFTSYLSKTTVENLNPGVNVVVGHNGAGKSNLFAAIRFALGDLPNDDLEQFQYLGRGSRSTFSHVEVKFADIGDRFANYNSEIAISREIVNGNDRFSVNDKYVTKEEMRALLDASGLSSGSGSAFFIVPQGDVNSMANATPQQRLDTLLRASGAKTFEDRKQAALNALDTADARLTDVSELLDRMDEHLQRVSEEADDLKEHIALRRDQRGIDFVMLKIERLRTTLVTAAEDEKLNAQRQRLEDAAAQLARHEAELDALRDGLSATESRVAEMSAEVEIAERATTLSRMRLREATNAASADASGNVGDASAEASFSMTLHGDQAMEVQDSQGDYGSAGARDVDMDMGDDDDVAEEDVDTDVVVSAEAELQAVRDELSTTTQELDTVNAEARALRLKKGRASQLKPAEIRRRRKAALDAIDESVAQLEPVLANDRARVAKLEAELQAAEEAIAAARTAASESQQSYGDAQRDHAQAEEQVAQAEADRNTALLAVRRATIATERLEKSADRLAKQLSTTSGAAAVRGVAAVREVAAELGLAPSQYFGTVADLVSVQPVVSVAAERVAGGQLLHHVVDSAETIDRIMQAMRARPTTSLSGAASFIPLAELVVAPAPAFPASDAASPLVELTSVADARFHKVLEHVFGRYLLCEDADTAVRYARDEQLHTVTVDGSMVEPSGMISGGAPALDLGGGPAANSGSGAKSAGAKPSGASAAGSRLELVREYSSMQAELLRQRADVVANREAADASAQRVTQAMDVLNRTRGELRTLALTSQDAAAPVATATTSSQLLASQRKTAAEAVSYAESKLAALRHEREAVESNFAGELSTAEEQRLVELDELSVELGTAAEKLGSREIALSRRALRLSHVLARTQRRAARLEAASARTAQSTVLRQALDAADEAHRAARADLEERRKRQRHAQEVVQESATELASAEEERAAIAHDVRTLDRRAENHSIKIQALRKLTSDLDERLAKLSNVPESALTRAQEYDWSDLQSVSMTAAELKVVARGLTEERAALDTQLERLGDVNERSINDYESFSADLETLKAQYDRLQTERSTIMATITRLDTQKHAKLNSVLSRVETEFRRVFAELSGGKKGHLVLVRDPESDELTSVDVFQTFGPSMAQLSGGQKCICALALIFAVQASDPAPLYVFDEIDANLDAEARRRVAKNIQRISRDQGLQFVITTFHEELVHAADLCYAVEFRKNESEVSEISRQHALDFVSAEVDIN